jgi:hypothetical protein
MSEFNAIAALEESGLLPPAPAGHTDPGHKAGKAREVLGSLTQGEVAVLESIRGRLTAAGAVATDDVEGHVTDVHGGFFW